MNIDISTSYAGLRLKSPVIASASSLTGKANKIEEMANQGVGAVVLKSIFEEQILDEIDSERVNNMYGNYADTENYVSFYTKKHNVDEYLNLIRSAKNNTDIPVIASVNCISASEWVEFAEKSQDAGADALELNMFILPGDIRQTGEDIEKSYTQILHEVGPLMKVPLTLKIHYYFSGVANMIYGLSQHQRVKALVLFNRFYNTDIDIHKKKITTGPIFSAPTDLSMPLRWTGILADKIDADLAISTGILDGEAVVKGLLAGAKVTQTASALYKKGLNAIEEMNTFLRQWMEQNQYTKIEDFRGLLSQKNIDRPELFERAQFMKYFSDYK
ncbi:MAG: dihydroorotate dehydrogenase-like protein [Bacteroidota bacterium]